MVGSSSLPESSEKLDIDGSGCSGETEHGEPFWSFVTCSESNGHSEETVLGGHVGEIGEAPFAVVYEGSSNGHSDETVCGGGYPYAELCDKVQRGLWPTGLNGRLAAASTGKLC